MFFWPISAQSRGFGLNSARACGPNYRYKIWIDLVVGLSRLPLWLTYRISDMAYFLLYYLIRYRKKVVRQNLERAFPALSGKERKQIEKKFYRHFCDLFVEIFRAFSMSDAELSGRYQIENPEVIDALIDDKVPAILLSHHYGNFEWMSTRMDLLFDRRIPTYGLYTLIKNPLAEELVHYMRSRRGIQMVPMTGAVKEVLNAFRKGPSAFGFLTDQAPSRGQKLYFGPMFGLPTATLTVVSKLVLRTGARLIYTDVKKVKRGHINVDWRYWRLPLFSPEGRSRCRLLLIINSKSWRKPSGEIPPIGYGRIGGSSICRGKGMTFRQPLTHMPNPEHIPAWLSGVSSDWTLFLDRDGVVNQRKKPGYIASISEFVLLPGVIEALVRLRQVFGRIVMVTNQQGVGKGIMTRQALSDIHAHFERTLFASGVKLDAILAATELAPHPSRKPESGMAHQALELFPEIEFAHSIMVGDTGTDLQFGANLGMRTVWIENALEPAKLREQADLTCSGLYQFSLLF